MLGTRLREQQRAGREIECCETDLGRRLRSGRAPLEPAGDHQMEDEKELSFHLPHDALPDAAQVDHAASFGGRERRIDRAQQRRAGDARALERLAHDAGGQRLEINRDVGKLRHSEMLSTGTPAAPPRPVQRARSLALPARAASPARTFRAQLPRLRRAPTPFLYPALSASAATLLP